MNSDRIYDVIIVGAGPVGLATGIGLSERGIKNFAIIEQAKAFRQVGQRVDLLPNGLKALKFINPSVYEELKQNNSSSTRTPSAWIYKNLQGEKIRSIPLDYQTWFEQYGEGRISTTWYDLQTLLRNHLPQERISINHRCINLVEESDCICVDCSSGSDETNPYAHWESDSPSNSEESISFSNIRSLRARLVIAADGINSTIRQILYQNSPYRDFAKPEYSGFAAIMCMNVPEIPHSLQAELAETILNDTPLVTIVPERIVEDPSMMLLRIPPASLGYVLHLAVSWQELQGRLGESLRDLAVGKLEEANFPRVLKQLVSLSPPANFQPRPYYIHRAIMGKIEPMWSKGRIVMVGDAAHGMPPFMAQGTNQGFEDAAAITTLMGELADNARWNNIEAVTQAFEKYDRLRRPRMDRIQKATLQRLSYGSSLEIQDYNQFVYSRNVDTI